MNETLEAILDGSAAETGWNTDSKLTVLLRFLDALAEDDPLIKEKFQDFLDEAVAEETDEKLEL